jgi:acyl-coenzyme A synthetase/AMP-(fatty) acid ligase
VEVAGLLDHPATGGEHRRLPQLLTFERWVPRPRAIFSSGAPLEADTAACYRARLGGAPIEVLGSTESGGIAHRQRDGSATADAWTPLPAVAVARAADGALVATSPWSGGSVRLEDEITLEGGGRFHLGTRMDRIVKLEGKRVSLPEIEARLVAHAWVAAAAVEPVPAGGRLGAVLVLSGAGAAVALRDGRAAVSRALREHLRGTVERVAVPRRFRIVTQLPLNERGKIDRSALLALLSDDHDAAA